MKPIARMNININGVFYNKGDEIEVKDRESLIKLNEKGFIEPLTMKEIQDYFEKSEIKLNFRKEEDKKWD